MQSSEELRSSVDRYSENRMTRRTFIAGTATALYVSGADDWREQADAIVARVPPPRFPTRDFEITQYGAKAGADVSGAIRKAMEACSAAGGGRVVVPAGLFLTGPIHLKNNVNLHVTEGATLRFSREPKDYPLVFTRWEGTECMNYSPLIYAFEQTNIGVTGTGTLDGQGDCDHWWPWKGGKTCGVSHEGPDQAKDRAALAALADKDVPVKDRVFGLGHYLRPQFIQPYRCQNVLIEGVKIRNSPMWEVHPVLCRNVMVRNLDISTHGPNNDGCDPESCRDIVIQGCTFDTGDDCIAIKSGRNQDGRRLHAPCENLVIENCTMKDGHGGVSIGSEVSGGIRNVFVRNCRMSSPHLERALRIKTNSYRGGVIENISFRNVTVGQVANDIVQIDFSYEEGEGGPNLPTVRNIDIRDVTCHKAVNALNLRGYASDPIRTVSAMHCKFDEVAKGNIIEHVDGLEVEDFNMNGKSWRP
jgi:polygalacturonase